MTLRVADTAAVELGDRGASATGGPYGSCCSRVPSSWRTSSRTVASGSSARISAEPISTASTPMRSSSSSWWVSEMPLSATTVLPAGTSGISSKVVEMSTAPLVEVAVVDADDLGTRLERALELSLVMDLDQAVEVESPGGWPQTR